MKRKGKLVFAAILAAAALLGTTLFGCSKSGDYTEEIREYQEKLESLSAENEALQAQLNEALGLSAPEETETEEEAPTESEVLPEEGIVSENEAPPQNEGDDLCKILVLGDSIWGNYRDETGVAAKVETYLGWSGCPAQVYNAAIGGSRATVDLDDDPNSFGPASDNSLAKMVSILEGNTDVAMLEGKPAYEPMQEVLQCKDEIDAVILAYGMNDFLNQAPINNSDSPWTGFGTALIQGVYGIQRVFPHARILIITPTYASYFSIPVANMGEKALYNYASVACDVAKGEHLLCMDAYNNLGIDMYNSDEYLEDGVHLNEKGRDLYARGVAGVLLYGQAGEVSGNAINFE